MITHQFEAIKISSDDLIFGRDIMNVLGLILNFEDEVVQCDDRSMRLNTGKSRIK